MRHPVQLYEALSLFILGAVLLRLIKKKVSGNTIISVYFVSYTIIRFILEFMRGDKIRGIYFLGLSTSQLISLILVAIIAGTWALKHFGKKKLE